MNILISGASGFIGSGILKYLTGRGHQVFFLVRRDPQNSSEICWNPVKGLIQEIPSCDAVIHLAGESVLGRWTPQKKKNILESRVRGTQFLAQSLVKMPQPPGVFICASAIGFYGNRGDEILDEKSYQGNGFLSDVCQAWEASCDPAIRAGIHTIHMRIGMVLGKNGGALQRQLLPFRLGLGGRMGDGKQFVSWIALEDLGCIIEFLLDHPEISGPVNVVSPNPVTHQEFTQILGKVLNRPARLPFPAFLARLMLGELADALILASTRVFPNQLIHHGFRFKYPDLEQALRSIL